jgi:hypothetical protein
VTASLPHRVIITRYVGTITFKKMQRQNDEGYRPLLSAYIGSCGVVRGGEG